MKDFDRSKEIVKARNIKLPIKGIFKKRYSPRAYTGEEISEEVFHTVLEAGRLAPSCSNWQPWRVIYGYRETEDWNQLFDLLVPGNQSWVANCGVLILFVSKLVDDKGKAWGTHSFDTGAFWCSMALEAANQGYPLHAMGGFDHGRAAELFGLGGRYNVEAMAAMGVPADVEALTEEQRAREMPNGRKEIVDLIVKANQARETLA